MSSPLDTRRTSAGGLSYAAVAGRKSPPSSDKHYGDFKAQSHPEDTVKSPRHIFAFRNKLGGPNVANSSPNNEGTMVASSAHGGTAQHYRKKGYLRKKKQPGPSSSPITHPWANQSAKSTMPVQVTNTAVDSQNSQLAGPSPTQNNGGQQKSEVPTITTTSDQKNISSAIPEPESGQTLIQVSAPEPNLQGGDNKSKTDVQRNQANPSPVAPISSVIGGHNPGADKPSNRDCAAGHLYTPRSIVKGSSTVNTPHKTNATQSAQSLESALIQNLKKRIKQQEEDITHYTEQLYSQSKDLGSMRAKIAMLEKNLNQKDDDIINVRLGHMNLIEKEGQIKQLETRCSTLDALLGECQPLVEHCKMMIEVRDVELATLRAETTKFRGIIHNGIISVADVYGPQAASEFTRTTKQEANKHSPSHSLSTTPREPGSPQMSQAHSPEPESTVLISPTKFNNSPPQNKQDPSEHVQTPQCGSGDPFVQGPANTSPTNNVNNNVPSFSLVLEENRRDPISHEVGEHDNKNIEVQGNLSWADEVEQQENQKEQPEYPRDVAGAEECAQSQGGVETPKVDNPQAPRMQPPSQGLGTGESNNSLDDTALAYPATLLPPLPSKAPNLPEPPRTIHTDPQQNIERRFANQIDQPISGNRGSHTNKLTNIYKDRKRRNQMAPRTYHGGNIHHHKTAVSEEKAGDEEGWTSVKPKAKPRNQPQYRGWAGRSEASLEAAEK